MPADPTPIKVNAPIEVTKPMLDGIIEGTSLDCEIHRVGDTCEIIRPGDPVVVDTYKIVGPESNEF